MEKKFYSFTTLFLFLVSMNIKAASSLAPKEPIRINEETATEIYDKIIKYYDSNSKKMINAKIVEATINKHFERASKNIKKTSSSRNFKPT